jgi:ABC-type transport system involved in cytochrome bd biosynthesis fused ATPase/permease subunit
MAPGKFYPLYLLAKLYDASGQQQKAIAMANTLLNKEVKVHSTAIEEIKEEMKVIIKIKERETTMNNTHDLKMNINSGSPPLGAKV